MYKESKAIYDFVSPAHKVGTGDIVITVFGSPAVRKSVRASKFSFSDNISETRYTHPLEGVDVPFGDYDL